MSLHIIEEPIKLPPQKTGGSGRYFLSMPHHPMFALGSLQAVLVMAWWLADLGGRYAGWYAPLQWTIPPVWAHLYLMIFTLFPLYMFGFLMTTYSRWMAGKPVSPRYYLPTAFLLAASLALGYAGLICGKGLLMVALLLHLAGWGMGIYTLLKVHLNAQQPGTVHTIVTSTVLILGWWLLLTLAGGVYLDNPSLVATARSGGIWWFLFPVFFSVSHRLIPFFSSVVIPGYQLVQPRSGLWLVVCGGLVHGALEMTGKHHLAWLIDLPMAACALWLSYAWDFRASFRARILAMLHIAFVWMGFALGLYGLQSLSDFSGWSLQLGRGPLHALLAGYFASMLVAMSTRVTLGHSGRPLSADNQAWGIFLLVQIAALLRVGAEFPAISAYAVPLYLASALLWLAAFVTWFFKFTPMYWRPTD